MNEKQKLIDHLENYFETFHTNYDVSHYMQLLIEELKNEESNDNAAK